jgi:hypothetical protein
VSGWVTFTTLGFVGGSARCAATTGERDKVGRLRGEFLPIGRGVNDSGIPAGKLSASWLLRTRVRI